MPNDIKITYVIHTGLTYTDVIGWEEVLAVPLDPNFVGGRVEPGDSVPKWIVSVLQVTAVSLLSSPTRLQLTYETQNGSEIATYSTNAMLKVARSTKPARNPSLYTPRTIYNHDGYQGTGEDYWLPINQLLTAELVPEKL